MITINYAKSKDINSCVIIDKKLKQKTNHSFLKEAQSANRIIIAKNKNEPVGYLLYYLAWGDRPLIELLRISPSYQRQKVGSKLIEKFEKKLKKQGFKFLYSATGSKNKNSIKFHQANGFKKCGLVNLDNEGEIFFRKKI